MTLTEKISADLKEAMKSKDKVALEAIRAAKTAFTIARTNKGADAVLTEDEELKIVQKLVKQRKDSAAVYAEQNRDELADKEKLEAEVLEKYLPEKMSEEELISKLKEIINQVGASTPADMGKVMGIASKSLAGKADGKMIAGKVRELLSN
jgi:uncharacterized protein YqeY